MPEIPRLMNHEDFHIGLEFWCGERRYRCTDIDKRTVLAIRVDQVTIVEKRGDRVTTSSTRGDVAEALGWFNGPPYAVVEQTFDEDDMEACSLTPEDDEAIRSY